MPESVARGTECANYYFTCYFLVEMLIKITGRASRQPGLNTFVPCLHLTVKQLAGFVP